MLFIHPAVQQDGAVQDVVAEVRTVPKPVKTGVPTWRDQLPLAQLGGPSGGTQPGVTPPVPEAPRANILPGAGTTNNPFGSSTNPVGATPVLPNQTSPNPTSTPGGNTYGTQQEGGGAPSAPAPVVPGATAPVTPGVPGPGAGTGGSSGMAAPEMATPPAGNVDTGSSSYQNLSSPYNSTGGGAGLTGTGMNTTSAPPNPGTGTIPGAPATTPAPAPSGASGTR